MVNRESDLREAVEAVCQRLGVKGHLLLYLDGDKIRFTGNMSLSALLPIVLEWVGKKK